MESNTERPKLFTEFPPVKTVEWAKQIREDLKGADYEKKLLRKLPEGMTIRPYYREEDLAEFSHIITIPGEFPFIRGKKFSSNSWIIIQDIQVKNLLSANKEAINAMKKGAGSVSFFFEKHIPGHTDQLSDLLSGINIESVPIHFHTSKNHFQLLKLLEEFARIADFNRLKIRGSLNVDPLTHIFLTGKPGDFLDFEVIRDMLDFGKENLPLFRIITINGTVFHESGSSTLQELAYTLAAGTEYLSRLTELGYDIDDIARRTVFHFSTGSDYFIEIAKIRAARMLWASIMKAFGTDEPVATCMSVHCSTSAWDKTIYDPFVNILRGTTEAMSAIIGGANSVSVSPFNMVYEDPSEFSSRIARNIQIILKEEAYLDKVVDPAAGSYFVENLTGSLADNAWKLFLEIEQKGGILEMFKKGKLQSAIEKMAEAKLSDMAAGKESLVGTNFFPNPEETASGKLKDSYDPSRSELSENYIIKPLKPTRAATAFEQLRLKTEKSGKIPVVFLLTFGNPAKSRARASFAAKLFNCGGFNVVDNIGFSSFEEGASAAEKIGADIVVLCSSDEEYTGAAHKAVRYFKGDVILVIAGYPSDNIEQLKGAGIKHFIHARSNVIEELGKFHKLLKIK